MKYLIWLLKAAVFFVFFAFALNNRDEVTLHFLLGYAVALPMAVVVLVSFALGAVLGVLVMMPRWWRQRQAAQRVQAPPPATTNAAPPASTAQPPASPADLARHMTDPSITIPYLEP